LLLRILCSLVAVPKAVAREFRKHGRNLKKAGLPEISSIELKAKSFNAAEV
jgi:hypothetical protein